MGGSLPQKATAEENFSQMRALQLAATYNSSLLDTIDAGHSESMASGAPGGTSTGSTAGLDKLIADSERALKRLEQLDNNKKLPLTKRASRHFSRNSSNLLNIALAGGVFAVAVSRLHEKYAHQVRGAFSG